MLGVVNGIELNLPNWTSVESRACLPMPEHEFLGKDGPMPLLPDSRRVYNRMYMRSRTLGYFNGGFHAAYLSDLSRSGVGFYSPVQLLPLVAAKLWLPVGTELRLRIRTCVRVQPHCYRCGAEFVQDKLSR